MALASGSVNPLGRSFCGLLTRILIPEAGLLANLRFTTAQPKTALRAAKSLCLTVFANGTLPVRGEGVANL